MSNKEITRQFLQLFAAYWDDPAVHQGFKALRDQVKGQGEWPRIIEARLLVLEMKTDEAVALLEAILTKEPMDYAAALLLARILNKAVCDYRKACAVLDKVLERGFEGQFVPEWFEALALNEKGYALRKEERWDEGLDPLQRVETRFGGSREPFLMTQVARALVITSVIHGMQGHLEEAIRVCEAVERRFGEITAPGLHEQVANALGNKGVALGKHGQLDKELRAYEEVEGRFGKATAPGLQEPVARALFNKGASLGQQGQQEEAIRAYEEVARRFGEAKTPGLQEQVAKALTNKGAALGQQGHPKKGIRAYEEVVHRFGEATAPNIQEPVARALVYKGWTLGDAEKWDDTISAYDEVVSRFEESQVPSLRKWVFEAQLRKSLAFLRMAKNKEARELFEKTQEALLRESTIQKELASLYTDVAQRFSREKSPADASQRQMLMDKDVAILKNDPESHLARILAHVLEEIDSTTQKIYFDDIKAAEKRTDRFITEDACFSDDFSFLLVLREWNSYTPVIPSAEESDRGGGYYIRHAGQGIVIDPGYDFIANYHRAGGRLGGIDHIIVTHAHDDHTAELEALLMLFERRWRMDGLPKKAVNLYLSAGVQRKFTGLLNLKDPKYGKVVTLCPDTNQRIKLNEKTTLTVLPAYHDDVITRDSAVGLGFEFDTGKEKRRVVFTGDSGFYPRDRKPDGEEKYYDNEKKHPALDTSPDKALFERYPEEFRNAPHLVIAHIGSIKEQEFGERDIPRPGEHGTRFYPNHLGLLGTLMLLHALRPDAAVISEFGAELKSFRIDLVQQLGLALNKVQKEMHPDDKESLVIVGDLTTAYDITNHRFLSHTERNGKFTFADLNELACRKAKDYLCSPKWNEEIEVSERKGSERAYLFNKQSQATTDNRNAKHYAVHFYERKLPYQTKPVTKGEEL